MVNDLFITLLIKELCEELTDVEREELNGLLRDSAECREQRQLLSAYWETERGEYEANTAMFKKVLERIRVEETPRRRFSLRVWHCAAAAVLLGAVAGYFYLFPGTGASKESAALHWQEHITKPTKKSLVILADSTVVTVNSGTVLRYPDHFNDSIREVYLDGEAYFDVSKDASRPFIIHTDKMNIRVLGTAFNVKSYRNERSGEATLIKGSIEVTLTDRPADRIILKPSEKLVVQNDPTIKKLVSTGNPPPDTTGKSTRYSLTNLTYFPNNSKTVIETSWVENKLVFKQKDFADLSGELERWYGVRIVFTNELVKEYNFTGFFEKETLAEALNALKMIENFNYKIADSVVYIY